MNAFTRRGSFYTRGAREAGFRRPVPEWKCPCGQGKAPHHATCVECRDAAPENILLMCADQRTRTEGLKQLAAFAVTRSSRTATKVKGLA